MFHGTTILAVRRNGMTVVGGDGQVTLDKIILKHGARKVRRLYENRVVVGFAGSTADAFTLFERFEGKLKEHNGQIVRAAVELAKEWRTDRALRQLQALLIAADKDHTLLVSGTGDVVEPDEDAVAIGSGGPYALAAAKGMLRHSQLDAEAIVREALTIASEIDIYTNNQLVLEKV
jgi:ATP-dependent HslUV protease subunit HslV